MSSVLAEPRAAESYRPAAAEDLALFHRTLAELCRARVPLPKALRMLQHDLGKGSLAKAAAAMAADVEEGVSLGTAYERRQQLFPELYRALIEAGIASSDLPGVLEEIAAYAAAEAEVKRRVRSALRYPFYVLVVVLLIGVSLVTLLPPLLSSLLDPLSQTFWSTDLVRIFRGTGTLSVAEYLNLLPWVGLGFLGSVLAALFLFAAVRRPRDGGGPRGLLFRLPVLGRLRTYAARASFAATLALLSRRSLPLPRMLALAATTANNSVTQEHIRQMLDRAESGDTMVESVRAGSLISPALMFLLRSAESCGTVPDALAEVARIYRQRLDRATDRLCMLIRPAAEVLLGIVVMLFALAYLFPALQFMEGIFGG